MSNTRRATADAPLSPERFLSDPLYAQTRAINATAVAARTAILESPVKRELIWWLQARSISPGHHATARELIALFPERIGTRTLLKIGTRNPARKLSHQEAQKIQAELRPDTWHPSPDDSPEGDSANTVAQMQRACREAAMLQLERFLSELCINPRMQFRVPGEEEIHLEIERRDVMDADPDCRAHSFTTAETPYFADIIGALFEFKRRAEDQARRDFVVTTIAEEVFRNIDFAAKARRMILIEGNSGVGKTSAARAYAQMNSGRVRLVELDGSNSKSSVFRSIAKAIGIHAGQGRTTTDLEMRIIDALQKTKVALLIDEAQHLLPAGRRVYSTPEVIDWLNCALVNKGVPVVLLATQAFSHRVRTVEKQVQWNSEQLRRRIRRHIILPPEPTDEDLAKVARKLLPNGTKEMVQLLVGYAKSSRLNLEAIPATIEEAQLIAEAAGRTEISFGDMDEAIYGVRLPSDQAQTEAFALTQNKPRETRPGRSKALPSSQAPAREIAPPCNTNPRAHPAEAQPLITV
jgi:DNA transposition AAA+ family ATPase